MVPGRVLICHTPAGEYVSNAWPGVPVSGATSSQTTEYTHRLVGAAVVHGDTDSQRHLFGDARLLKLLRVEAASKADLGVVLSTQLQRKYR